MSHLLRGSSVVSRGRAVYLAFALLAPANVPAQAQVITEFSTGITAPSEPHGITAGPDGNMWFAEFAAHKIGRITPAGVVMEFTTSPDAFPWGIANGPDGNLWFTEQSVVGQSGNRIGRITPAGVIAEFSAGITGASLAGIAAGPDGNLWFTEIFNPRIGRITPSGVVTEFAAGLNGVPHGITAGPDGNMWFTEVSDPGRIGRITMAGVITEFDPITPNGGIEAITVGADGNLWYADQNNDLIGKITTSGVVTEYPIGNPGFAQVRGIAAGPDGNLWFAEYSGNRVGRITPSGVVTEFASGITGNTKPRMIAAGPDGNLWFTEEAASRIGRITTGIAGPPGFFPLAACRVLDTRFPTGALGGPPLEPAGSLDRLFVMTDTCGIPTDAVALSANVTVTNTGAPGYLSLYRGDGARTGTYSITFNTGQTRASNDMLQLALDGTGSFKVENSAPGIVDFVLDVNGFFR